MQRIIKGTIGVLLYFLLIMPGGCYVIAVVVENIGLRFDQPAADGWTVLVGLLWLVWIIYTAPRICVWLINIPSRRRAKRDAASRQLGDVLNNPISVARLVGQRQKHVEQQRGQREKRRR